MNKDHINRPIGVFDSGMGGISVLAELMEWMPNERFVYFGDSLNAPYGARSKKEVKELAFDACDYLSQKKVKAIVVACNTATSVAISELRKKFPIPIVGMEPALKVAVDSNPDGAVLVMATPMTLKEKKFNDLMEGFSQKGKIEKLPAPGLVDLVERGILDGDEVEEELRACLGDLTQRGISTIVLGCTHFVFLDEAIKKAYSDVDLVDGNKGTARHVMNLLTGRDLLNRETLDETRVDLCSSSEDPETIDIFKMLLKERIEKIMNCRKKRETEKELEKRIIEEIRLAIREDKKLSQREKELISYRYGINRDKITEAEKIARKLNVPKAKVEIMMEKAERKLFNIIKARI